MGQGKSGTPKKSALPNQILGYAGFVSPEEMQTYQAIKGKPPSKAKAVKARAERKRKKRHRKRSK